MALDPVETLQRLVAVPSVNPMGREPVGPLEGEARLTDVLQEICTAHAWPWLRQQVHPGRDNLLALVSGEPAPGDGRPLLLWEVHQDTVAVDGMTIDPFEGELRDGRVFGRGASDVKGSMAAMLVAASRLKDEPTADGPAIVLAFSVNEERGFTGAQSMCRLWAEQEDSAIVAGNTSAAHLFPRPPDAAIVAEPTDLDVVVAHQGVLRWRCHTLGRAVHSSRPDEGANAIYAMARVIEAIERYHHELAETAAEHSLCGRPSVCVGTIQGGVGYNTVPDRATIEIDRRLSPGDDPAEVYESMLQYLGEVTELGDCSLKHDEPYQAHAGLADGANRQLAERLAQLATAHGRNSRLVGVPYSTDATAIAKSGVPTVVFGPGSIADAHTADESIDVAELVLGAEVFYDVARQGIT